MRSRLVSFSLIETEKIPLLRCSPMFKEPAAKVTLDHTQMLLEFGGKLAQRGGLSSHPTYFLTSSFSRKSKVQRSVML